MSTLWKINCMERKFPGMWQRWFKNQCVAVGWSADWGYKLDGTGKRTKGWSTARNAIISMKPGDYVVVTLSGNRIGRIGEITGKAIGDDEWYPFVPITPYMPQGEMGRRIYVRWDLIAGPDDQDLVIKMPEGKTFSIGELRLSVARINSTSIDELLKVMDDEKNWVNLLGKFGDEKALSDYIATYPNRLEDGLLPHPNLKIRERVFGDKTRLDVLLIDKENLPVIVECKQHGPSTKDVKQLRQYMRHLKKETGEKVRGILVHGGAQKISSAVLLDAKKNPPIEIVSYSLDVNFKSSYAHG